VIINALLIHNKGKLLEHGKTIYITLTKPLLIKYRIGRNGSGNVPHAEGVEKGERKRSHEALGRGRHRKIGASAFHGQYQYVIFHKPVG